MCGIAGFLDARGALDAEHLAATGAAMAATLRHRGPDDSGVWIDPAVGISLAHQRLAILDLSPAGRQPIVSSCGRLVLTYNGEIYNHAELRRELEARGRRFRGHCDSEVLVEACAEWGVETALGRLNGMFAFAVWDRVTRMLALARDRVGIKPLYWARFGNLFMFGSELKALRAHPGWAPEIDRDSLAAFVRYSYVPAPHSIYCGVFKLLPGHLLVLPYADAPEIHPYWDAREVAAAAAADRLDVSEAEAVDDLESLLRDTVGRHMAADVPLGAFLSGGIDSSVVAALMQAQSSRPINTYTIGFAEPRYDEARHAREVAAHLGTAHTELYVAPEQALAIIPELPRWYDEPFADSSQIPTLLLSELTRRHVTVALSGDGGDELLGGYTSYYKARALAQAGRYLPMPLRGATAGATAAATEWILAGGAMLSGILPVFLRHKLSLNRRSVLTHTFVGASENDLYRQVVCPLEDSAAVMSDARERPDLLQDATTEATLPDFMERIGFLDMMTRLPDGMLTKVDRASMAFGLEVRVPLLDHRVVEYVWRLAPALKYVDAGENKRLLRRVLYRYVPRALVDRPKRGFDVPIKAWLWGPLRAWAEELLDERRLAEDGFFDPTLVRARWHEHLAGMHNRGKLLWRVLMFQQWRRHQAAEFAITSGCPGASGIDHSAPPEAPATVWSHASN